MVMSAISLAMAAPSLMAMPASASERAGESLMPSPTISTVCPSRRMAATYSALSAGRTPARKSSTPSCSAMEAAVRGLSPVSITRFLRPDSAGQKEPPVPPLAEDRRCRSQQRAPCRWQDRVGRTQGAARVELSPLLSRNYALLILEDEVAPLMHTCSSSTELAMP